LVCYFSFNAPSHPRIYTLSLHDALPIYYGNGRKLEYDFNVAPGGDPSAIDLSFDGVRKVEIDGKGDLVLLNHAGEALRLQKPIRSEEHTSELQSRSDLVCRLLLEKKKNK